MGSPYDVTDVLPRDDFRRRQRSGWERVRRHHRQSICRQPRVGWRRPCTLALQSRHNLHILPHPAPAYHHRDAPPRRAPGHLRLQWHLPRCWHNFTADTLRRCIAEETGGGREEEAFDDYDCIPPPPYHHWLSLLTYFGEREAHGQMVPRFSPRRSIVPAAVAGARRGWPLRVLASGTGHVGGLFRSGSADRAA